MLIPQAEFNLKLESGILDSSLASALSTMRLTSALLASVPVPLKLKVTPHLISQSQLSQLLFMIAGPILNDKSSRAVCTICSILSGPITHFVPGNQCSESMLFGGGLELDSNARIHE